MTAFQVVLRAVAAGDFDSLVRGEANAAIVGDCEFVDGEPSAVFIRSQSYGWARAKNGVAGGADPIDMSVAVKDESARSVRRDCGQDIRCIHQSEAHAITEADSGDRVFDDLVV